MQEFNIDETKLEEYAINVKDWCLVNGILIINSVFVVDL